MIALPAKSMQFYELVKICASTCFKIQERWPSGADSFANESELNTLGRSVELDTGIEWLQKANFS